MERLYRLGKWPVFVYLLPVFFVLHGFTHNFYLIPLADSLWLLSKYLVGVIIVHVVFFFILRNNSRASLLTFLLMAIYFFFGAIHDTLKWLLPDTFFSRYVFVLPFIALVTALFVVLIRRIRNYSRYKAYLNVLFFIFIITDLIILSGKISSYGHQRQFQSIHKEFSACDTCNKPDVYLIVMDEYSGEKTLNDLFNFDNTAFLEDLKDRNFKIVKNSTSNYNITPVSIASLLNIDYVNVEGASLKDVPMKRMYELIDTNKLVSFFKFLGYEFINNSIFTVNGQPPSATQTITPTGTSILKSQTLIERLKKDLGYHLINWHILKSLREDDYAIMKNNNKIIGKIKDQAPSAGKEPRFSYSHLTMPHFPYYFDSNGSPYAQSEIVEGKGNEWREERYLEYLKYTNTVIVDLVDFVLKHSQKPPVIILLSDHGFRLHSKNGHEEYDFYNLNATFMPPQYSPAFEDNLSNISYMRELLNLLFNQHLKAGQQDRFYIPITPQDIKGQSSDSE